MDTCCGPFGARVFLLVLLCAGKLHAEQCSKEASMRLVNGPTVHCGRVEVCHDGVWGTVCDDRFGRYDADVVCRTIGRYEEHKSIHPRAYFGEGEDPIWLDNANCAASFRHITQCTPLRWGIHNCKHDEDVGVCCKRLAAPKPPSLPVRLVSPADDPLPYSRCPDKLHPHGVPSVSGIVEVKVNGVWGKISTADWTPTAATVLCGEIGYPLATAMTSDDIDNEVTEVLSGSGDGALYPLPDNLPDHLPDNLPDNLSDNLSDNLPDNLPDHLPDNLPDNLPDYNQTYLQELECTGRESDLLSCFFSKLGPQENPTGSVAAVNCSCKPFSPETKVN